MYCQLVDMTWETKGDGENVGAAQDENGPDAGQGGGQETVVCGRGCHLQVQPEAHLLRLENFCSISHFLQAFLQL